jgi:hypothetical protein
VSGEMGGADRGECDRPVDLGCQVYLVGNKAGADVCSSRRPRCRRSARVRVHESIHMSWGGGGCDDGGCHVFVLMPPSSFICMHPQHTHVDAHKLLPLHTRAFAVCTHVYASMYFSIQAIQALDKHCHQCHRPNGIVVVFFPHLLLVLNKIVMPRKVKSVARNLKHAVLSEAVIPKKNSFVWILCEATFSLSLN